MFLVVDTNVLFAFAKSPKVVGLIEKSRNFGVKLITPQFCFEELINLKADIIKYAGFSEEEFEFFIREIEKVFFVVPEFLYEDFIGDGKKVSPDKKDIALFALSLAFEKTPIWSREPKLKKQKIVKVLDDKDIEELVKNLE